MKPLLLLALSAGLLLAGDRPGAQFPGRFTLLAATLDLDDTTPRPSLFKIDTATGATWRLETAIVDIPASFKTAANIRRARITGWTPIGDLTDQINQFTPTNRLPPDP